MDGTQGPCLFPQPLGSWRRQGCSLGRSCVLHLALKATVRNRCMRPVEKKSLREALCGVFSVTGPTFLDHPRTCIS